MVDLATLLVGGAAGRPDSISGMNPAFVQALQAMMTAAPPAIAAQFRINSGYRSPQVQAGLWQNALRKYGSPEVARKWVAPPGNSQHGKGNAADLQFLDAAARQWAHANAAKYGLAFPLGNEPWHIELAGARGSSPSATVKTATDTPGQVVEPQIAAPAAPAPAGGGIMDLLAAALPAIGNAVQKPEPAIDPSIAALMAQVAAAQIQQTPPPAPTVNLPPVPLDPLARGVTPNRYFV